MTLWFCGSMEDLVVLPSWACLVRTGLFSSKKELQNWRKTSMLGTRKPIFCTWKAQQKSDFQREIPQYQTILPRPKTTTWPWSSSSRPTNHSKIMISTLQAKATQAFTSPVWQTRLSQTTSNNQHKNERSTSRESYSATPALTPPNATLPNTSPGTR